MKIGEIWLYKGKIEPDKEGRRWFTDYDEEFGYTDVGFYMDKVRIVSLNYVENKKFGQMIEFEALEGESHPMEAVFAMPIALFLKTYKRDYNEN